MRFSNNKNGIKLENLSLKQEKNSKDIINNSFLNNITQIQESKINDKTGFRFMNETFNVKDNYNSKFLNENKIFNDKSLNYFGFSDTNDMIEKKIRDKYEKMNFEKKNNSFGKEINILNDSDFLITDSVKNDNGNIKDENKNKNLKYNKNERKFNFKTFDRELNEQDFYWINMNDENHMNVYKTYKDHDKKLTCVRDEIHLPKGNDLIDQKCFNEFNITLNKANDDIIHGNNEEFFVLEKENNISNLNDHFNVKSVINEKINLNDSITKSLKNENNNQNINKNNKNIIINDNKSIFDNICIDKSTIKFSDLNVNEDW